MAEGGNAENVGRKRKDTFLDMTFIDQVNKRENKDFGLFENYQINPYTKKTLDFVTPKVNTRPPKLAPHCVPGYCQIKNSLWKSYVGPMELFSEPQTELHRLGWFTNGEGYFDKENYDDRFKFSHQTAEFIKTQAKLMEYDRLMGKIGPRGKPTDPVGP